MLTEARPARGTGLVLHLEQGRAEVRLPPQELAPGIALSALVMEVPAVEEPLDAGAGAAQFRHRLCDLVRLDLELSEAALAALLGHLDLGLAGLSSLGLALRAGFVEARGALPGGEAATLKAAVVPGLGAPAELALVVYAPRVFPGAEALERERHPGGFTSAGEAAAGVDAVRAEAARRARAAPCPAALPGLVAAACGAARRLGPALVVNPLPSVLRRLLPSRGWKVPRTTGVRVVRAEVTGGRLLVGWARAPDEGAGTASDPDLRAALDGARAFPEAEALLDAGQVAGARAAYLALGEAARAHPHGRTRLLALLAAEESSHPAAMALAAAVTREHPDDPDALLASARVEASRSGAALASVRYAAAAAALLRRGEDGAALAAAEACLALGAAADPAARAQATDLALSLSRSHLPALRALCQRGEAGDAAALLRACRRLAAYATDPAEKAAAHARLGALLAREDAAAARLHLEHACRLAPSDPVLLAGLARAFDEAGDPERGRALTEQLHATAAALGDARSAAEAALGLAERALGAGEVRRARDLVREAGRLGLPREDGAAAWEAVAAAAAAAGDAAVEAEALTAVAATLPIGRRPAALLRLSALALAAGSPAAARQHAEAARTLSPTDPAAAEACRAAALAQGDLAALPALLETLAGLVPGRSGALQLERARRLLALGQAEEADGAFALALAALPPDLALAREAVRIRRGGPAVVRGRPWAEPLERFAARTADGPAAAAALGEAALLAEEQGDRGASLRCARGALAGMGSPPEPATALPLARILYLGGAAREALALHRGLFEMSGPGTAGDPASGGIEGGSGGAGGGTSRARPWRRSGSWPTWPRRSTLRSRWRRWSGSWPWPRTTPRPRWSGSGSTRTGGGRCWRWPAPPATPRAPGPGPRSSCGLSRLPGAS